jgi:hypothetical protein
MHVETFPVIVEEGENLKLLEKRYPLGGDRQAHFDRPRTEDLSHVIGFGLAYFIDATQSIWFSIMTGRSAEGITGFSLPSGWTVRALDLGRVWERHLEFASEGKDEGFIVSCGLEMVEGPLPGAKPRTLADVLLPFKQEREDKRLLRENSISDAYHPEDCDQFETFSFYSYGTNKGSRDKLIEDLKAGKGVKTWAYRPQPNLVMNLMSPRLHTTGKNFVASSTTKAINLDESLTALIMASEFLRALDSAGLEEKLKAHAKHSYCALDEDDAELFSIIRPILTSSAYPGTEFPEFIEMMWKRTAAISLMDQIDILKTAAKLLIEDGHTFPNNTVYQYSHDLFARAADDGLAIFMIESDKTTSYIIERDRVIVADLDEKTMAVNRVLLDFAIYGHDITLIRPTETRLSADAARIGYGLNSIISFHDNEMDKPRKYPR